MATTLVLVVVIGADGGGVIGSFEVDLFTVTVSEVDVTVEVIEALLLALVNDWELFGAEFNVLKVVLVVFC